MSTTTNSYRAPFHILYKMSTTTTPTTSSATTYVYIKDQSKLEPKEASSKINTFSVSLKSCLFRDKFMVLTLTMVPSKKPQITRTWVHKSGKRRNRVTTLSKKH